VVGSSALMMRDKINRPIKDIDIVIPLDYGVYRTVSKTNISKTLHYTKGTIFNGNNDLIDDLDVVMDERVNSGEYTINGIDIRCFGIHYDNLLIDLMFNPSETNFDLIDDMRVTPIDNIIEYKKAYIKRIEKRFTKQTPIETLKKLERKGSREKLSKTDEKLLISLDKHKKDLEYLSNI
jgi:hypothetical protein